MKYFISPSKAATLVERQAIRENYESNIVFQWLKLPCLTYCKPNGLLTHEDLFCLSFQFLDFLKQYHDYSDCLLHNELQCIPFEIARHWENFRGEPHPCNVEKLLAIRTLYQLLQMIEPYNDDMDQYHLEESLTCNIPKIFPKYSKEYVQSVITDIDHILTVKSPIYLRSVKIMSDEDCCETTEPHLIDYIDGYMQSPQRISEEIANGKAPTAQPSENKPRTDTPELARLQEELKQKDEQIEDLQRLLDTFAQPDKGYIEIDSTCKVKIVALLSAMFYAHFFRGVGMSNNRDQVVGHILKYGFHYNTKSIPQMLSRYDKHSGGIDDLKRLLNEALDELKGIRKEKKNEK